MKVIRFLDAAGTLRTGALNPDGSATLVSGDAFGPWKSTGEKAVVKKLLAPIQPSQILCIGLNYGRHADEAAMKRPEIPVLFAKGINTVQNPNDPIEIPQHLASEEVDYECELAVVIGRGPGGRLCKNVSPQDALSYVLGYTCANDVSARDWQIKRGGGQWCRGKWFDTFCPLGPCLVTPDEIPNPNALKISTNLNGDMVQDWTTSDMIFDVPRLISFLSGSTTLTPGTVILTGTPHGVGMAAKPVARWLRPGDKITIQIEGIGKLFNPVVLEPV
jgi:2-keto-4-pentenoate hydratase/2-oxohepta-3-ene-1,7-dioic acid hydratase in catechol pathway